MMRPAGQQLWCMHCPCLRIRQCRPPWGCSETWCEWSVLLQGPIRVNRFLLFGKRQYMRIKSRTVGALRYRRGFASKPHSNCFVEVIWTVWTFCTDHSTESRSDPFYNALFVYTNYNII